MDEQQAADQESVGNATPIFNVYRRGYDPEQVDRYVADQQRRLDEAVYRASEAERKLAAAVGQLRELHRRVAVYESEARSAQPPALDTLGERVQRILQEAWEGAYNLRQEAEREVNELREQATSEVEAKRAEAERDIEELRQVASREAAELVDEATRRALALRDEMDRRRQAYLERVEADRQRAVGQISYLYDQREMAISELVRLQATVQATVEEMVHSPLAKEAADIARSAAQETSRDPLPELVLDDLSSDPTEAAGEAASAGSEQDGGLLSSYLDETIVGTDDATLVAEGDEGALFSSLLEDHYAAPTEGEASGVADIPTGPMDALEYGLGPEGSLRDQEQPGWEYEEASQAPEAAPRGGLYDAEADGWS